jgi:5-methylcytosine-specific restriction endonuclease McrA
VAPDPKPRRRIRASTPRSRTVAYERAHRSACALCGAQRGVQAAHVVPRSQGGDDVAENVAPLCLDCHWWIDQGAGPDARDLRVRLRAWIAGEPTVLAYVLDRKGAAWLDRRYPAR